MDRILTSTPGTASYQFTQDGVNADPGTTTIKITRDDGTVLVAAGTATSGTGTAARTFALTTTHTAALDVLALTWTSANFGVQTSYMEVVGGFLFSLSDARALRPLNDSTTYTTSNLLAARVAAEWALEDACSVAFVPRYMRETLDGRGGTDLVVSRSKLRSVLAVSVNGTALTQTELDALGIYPDGRIWRRAGWPRDRRNIVVKYTHGYLIPPPRVGRAALLLAKRILVDSPISDRALSVQDPSGTTSFFVTAGVRNAVFDIPEANACISEYGEGQFLIA